MSLQSTEFILDAHVFFVESPKFELAEIDIPDAIIDFFKSDVFSDTSDGNINPMVVPANTTITANVAHFETIRVLERRDFIRHFPA